MFNSNSEREVFFLLTMPEKQQQTPSTYRTYTFYAYIVRVWTAGSPIDDPWAEDVPRQRVPTVGSNLASQLAKILL